MIIDDATKLPIGNCIYCKKELLGYPNLSEKYVCNKCKKENE